jgi:hypothetical protein
MRISKVFILAWSLAVGGAAFIPQISLAQTQSAEDQARALEALRKAEAQPVTPEDINAPAVAAPVQAPPAHENVERAPAAPSQSNFTAAPAPNADQLQALQALRQAESQPVTVDPTVPAGNAPSSAVQNVPISQDQSATASRAQELAAERAITERATAEERAREARTHAEAEKLKRQMKKTAPTEPVVAPPTDKEHRLADLLRRYEADEITPYEYHLQRAKIIAEP